MSHGSPAKRDRQSAILRLIKAHRVESQERIRDLLAGEGIEVAQATLSRDIRDLRLVKIPGADGKSHYSLPDEWEHAPPLESLLPTLMTGVAASGNLLVVRTFMGGAQAMASAMDWEEWPEVLGTIAGDDTILLVLRSPDDAEVLIDRLETIRKGE